MKVFLYVFAACSGLLNAVLAGCNSTLGKSIGQMQAAVVIGLVTTATAVVFGVVSGQLAWPGADKLAAAPWWAWVGGVLGATFILSQLFVAGQVGSGVFIALTVTATVTMSLVIDHYGLLGFDVRPASWGRIAGALFMFAGLGLIAKF
jgi:transporter family-2 protein